ncbi:MAG: ecotin family protein [Thiohalomonadaceae bacterium]
MKHYIYTNILVGILACTGITACAQHSTAAPNPTSRKELTAFPKELTGYQRYVIELSAKNHENNYKIELIGGKTMPVDCNLHRLNGKFVRHEITGWGYNYWLLQSEGQTLGTMMACPSDSVHDEFVTAEPLLLRYNSKLPVVVFVPEGMELRYRIWQAGAEQKANKD